MQLLFIFDEQGIIKYIGYRNMKEVHVMKRSEVFIYSFLSHRKVTEKLVEKIGEDNYLYKPTETSMSAQTLVLHMLTSFYHFACAAAKTPPIDPYADEEEINLKKLTKIYTEETVKVLQSMSDEDFTKEVDLTKIIGIMLPADQVLQMAIEHEIHHKGNLFVYVRGMGHTDLPLFVDRG